MKEVSIKDLKAHLSAHIAAAEGGEAVLIARHGYVVAQLGPAGSSTVHTGAASGTARLTPAVRRATKGRYLQVLLDDRGDR
jgi:antitoxin (DNA-binding transcriptional repressor) of toxin-antitoxin stability system